MLSRTTGQLPNAVTCMNLISGCIAIYMAFHMEVVFGPLTGASWAMIAIGAAAVFDFLDGFTARALHKFSPLGKDLDSLSDLVSFGVAPAMLVLNMMEPHSPQPTPFIALMIAVCGAIRLATFNTDTEQSVNFRGLPIPANAIFWIGVYGWIERYTYPGWGVMAVLIVLDSLAMVGRFKMFSLKFKNFSLRDNLFRYILILSAIVSVALTGLPGFFITILIYFLLSFLKRKNL